MPAVSTGFTDSHFFRDRGIASYGYAPFLMPQADESGVHGNNERHLGRERAHRYADDVRDRKAGGLAITTGKCATSSYG